MSEYDSMNTSQRVAAAAEALDFPKASLISEAADLATSVADLQGLQRIGAAAAERHNYLVGALDLRSGIIPYSLWGSLVMGEEMDDRFQPVSFEVDDSYFDEHWVTIGDNSTQIDGDQAMLLNILLLNRGRQMRKDDIALFAGESFNANQVHGGLVEQLTRDLEIDADLLLQKPGKTSSIRWGISEAVVVSGYVATVETVAPEAVTNLKEIETPEADGAESALAPGQPVETDQQLPTGHETDSYDVDSVTINGVRHMLEGEVLAIMRRLFIERESINPQPISIYRLAAYVYELPDFRNVDPAYSEQILSLMHDTIFPQINRGRRNEVVAQMRFPGQPLTYELRSGVEIDFGDQSFLHSNEAAESTTTEVEKFSIWIGGVEVEIEESSRTIIEALIEQAGHEIPLRASFLRANYSEFRHTSDEEINQRLRDIYYRAIAPALKKSGREDALMLSGTDADLNLELLEEGAVSLSKPEKRATLERLIQKLDAADQAIIRELSKGASTLQELAGKIEKYEPASWKAMIRIKELVIKLNEGYLALFLVDAEHTVNDAGDATVQLIGNGVEALYQQMHASTESADSGTPSPKKVETPSAVKPDLVAVIAEGMDGQLFVDRFSGASSEVVFTSDERSLISRLPGPNERAIDLNRLMKKLNIATDPTFRQVWIDTHLNEFLQKYPGLVETVVSKGVTGYRRRFEISKD